MSHTLQLDFSPRVPISKEEVLKASERLGGGRISTQLIAALVAPGATMKEIVDVLSQDALLTARVLRVANSPIYGRSGEVGTLDRAIQFLGLRSVRGIAIAATLDRAPVRGMDQDVHARFRLHAVAVAAAAQTLAERKGHELGAEAMIAGLLHDIGWLVISQLRPDYFRDSMNGTSRLLEEEREIVGLNHAECAALVLEQWRVPAWLKAVVQSHHDTTCTKDSLTEILKVAEVLALDAGFGLTAEGNVGSTCLLGGTCGAVIDLPSDYSILLSARVSSLMAGLGFV